MELDKKTSQIYMKNIFSILIIFIFFGHFIQKCLSGSWELKGLFLFIYSFSFPLLIFLIGTIFKRIENDKGKVLKITIYFIILYILMKVFTTIIKLPFTGKWDFKLFTESGMAWIFLAVSIYFIIGYNLKNANKKILLVLSIILAFTCGYTKLIGDFLVMSRLLVFLPIFIIGWIIGIDKIEEITNKKSLKISSILILICVGISFIVFSKRIYFMRPLFLGRSNYFALENQYMYGPLYRLLSYLITTIISISILALTPRKSLGKFFNNIESNFISIYFLHGLVLCLITSFEGFEKLIKIFGVDIARILFMGMPLVLIPILSIKIFKYPFTIIFKLLDGNYLTEIWCKASKNKKRLIYCIIYTIAFLIVFVIAFTAFFEKGASLIWHIDGRKQVFPHIIYLGRAIRNVVFSLFNGSVVIPLFNVNIGDIISFLNAQWATDPLLLISAVVPAKHTEALYSFLTIFKIYLAGLSFSYLCFYFKKRKSHTLIGSIIYCFASYAFITMVKRPNFASPMIQLPLLIIGIDKILKREKPYVFIFTVFYSALCGYYHLYMMTIMVCIYALLRIFDLYKEKRFKEFCLALVRGAMAFALGIGLAAIVLLPSIYQFFNISRASLSNFVNSGPTLQSLAVRVMRLIAPSASTSYSNPGMAAISLFAVVLMLCSKKRRTLKILVVLAFITWNYSIGSFIMNGFQYPTNRWIFALFLLVAYIVVEMLPNLLNLTTSQKNICIFTLCVYGITLFNDSIIRKTSYLIVGLCFLALTLLVLTMIIKKQSKKSKEKNNYYSSNIRAIMCLILVIFNAGVYGIYFYAPDQGNFVSEFNKYGVETEILDNSVEHEMSEYLQDNPEGRVDSSLFTSNTPLVWDIPSANIFTSTLSENISDFWIKMDRPEITHMANVEINNTDQRTITNTLLSTKYQIESKDTKQYVPYGYAPIKETYKGNTIYENKYALPWGYTYDNSISYSELENLNGLQRQEAMLQSIVLDDDNTNKKITDIIFDEEKVPYTIEYENCIWENNKLIVNEKNATATLNFNMPKNVEGYIYFDGLDINDTNISYFFMSVKSDEISKSTVVASKLSIGAYYGRENYLFNLGYSENKRNSLTVTFPSKGTFKLDNIELYALPMTKYAERVEKLREEPLENITIKDNHISGTVDLSKDKILCLTIPYSAGWTATVDGLQTEIKQGNYMFMALPLKAGHHDIELNYCTPGLKVGIIITSCSIIVLGYMIIIERRKNK